MQHEIEDRLSREDPARRAELRRPREGRCRERRVRVRERSARRRPRRGRRRRRRRDHRDPRPGGRERRVTLRHLRSDTRGWMPRHPPFVVSRIAHCDRQHRQWRCDPAVRLHVPAVRHCVQPGLVTTSCRTTRRPRSTAPGRSTAPRPPLRLRSSQPAPTPTTEPAPPKRHGKRR